MRTSSHLPRTMPNASSKRHVSTRSNGDALERNARPEVAEPPRLETRGRARLDDAAVVRAVLVDRTRVSARRRYVETRATFSRVLHESEARRLRFEVGVEREEPLAHARLVAFEQMYGPG